MPQKRLTGFELKCSLVQDSHGSMMPSQQFSIDTPKLQRETNGQRNFFDLVIMSRQNYNAAFLSFHDHNYR